MIAKYFVCLFSVFWLHPGSLCGTRDYVVYFFFSLNMFVLTEKGEQRKQTEKTDFYDKVSVAQTGMLARGSEDNGNTIWSSFVINAISGRRGAVWSACQRRLTKEDTSGIILTLLKFVQ